MTAGLVAAALGAGVVGPSPGPARPVPAERPLVPAAAEAAVVEAAPSTAPRAASRPPRGYRPRPCGFDLDFDGVAGEAEDCAALCRGGPGNLDVDGNGVRDRTVYVDCEAGADSPACGAAASPCRSVQFALDGANAAFRHHLREPAPGQIQAVCFRGFCGGETLVPTHSGAPGVYARPASGSEARDFELPRFPLIVSGWDGDGDGVFPPFDADDTAVLDGTGATAMAVRNERFRSRFELAHFSARDYGGCSGTAGFFEPAPGPGEAVSHTYLHDLELTAISAGCGGASSASGRIVFQMWAPSGASYRWGAFVNLAVDGYGAYLARGAGGAGESGPFRFQGLTAVMRGAPGDVGFGFKIWSLYSGIEILDSLFDGDPRGWSPERTTMVVPAQCSRDWVIRNNELRDLWLPFNLQGNGDALACDERNLDDVLIDGNRVRNTYEPYAWGDVDVLVGAAPGTSATGTVEDVTIVNNVFSSTTGRESGVRVQVGHDGGGAAPGRVVIAGNTFDGPYNRDGAVALLAAGASRQQRIEVRNNVFSGLGRGDALIFADYEPAELVSDSNVFDRRGIFRWGASTFFALEAWSRQSGRDGRSRVCSPRYTDAAAGDFHLDWHDRCARDAGETLAADLAHDLDGDPRGDGDPWDAGADEVPARQAPLEPLVP